MSSLLLQVFGAKINIFVGIPKFISKKVYGIPLILHKEGGVGYGLAAREQRGHHALVDGLPDDGEPLFPREHPLLTDASCRCT